MKDFSIQVPQKIVFGIDKINELIHYMLQFGRNALILTGNSSFYCNDISKAIAKAIEENNINYAVEKVNSEPTVKLVDMLSQKHRNLDYDMIVAIGGGSVIDCAKALKVMLKEEGSVKDYIEGVGTKTLSGTSLKMIAVPTTSGTGSECTKNAVISSYTENAFKRSLRHECLMPEVAIIDPMLTLSCPYQVTLNCAMDSFCQLIEAYISKNANPFCDALMEKGIQTLAENIILACEDGNNVEARSHLAYASMLSGIGVANSSMTVIHGFASSIGAMYHNIPHGAICGALLYASTLLNMQKLQMFDPDGVATEKYARIGSLISGIDYSYEKHSVLLRAVTDYLSELKEDLKIPTLAQIGVKKEDFYKIVSSVRQNANPVTLAETELVAILEDSY